MRKVFTTHIHDLQITIQYWYSLYLLNTTMCTASTSQYFLLTYSKFYIHIQWIFNNLNLNGINHKNNNTI